MYDNSGELNQIGRVAAWEAIETYSADKGKTFDNYILMRVAYAMKSSIRSECEYLKHFIFELDVPETCQLSHEAPRVVNPIRELESSGALDIQVAYKCLGGMRKHLTVMYLHYQEGMSFAAIARGGYLGKRVSREWPRVLHAEAIKIIRAYMIKERK